MTDHKPFTAEQLDELDRGYRNTYWACLDPETRGRLIAQAREANRLRADLQAALGDARELLNNGELVLSGRIDSVCDGNPNQHAEVDPAARAKRELGEWLADKRQRTWDESDQTKHSGRWIVELWESSLDPESDCDYRGTDPTEHEAITAALRAAKESGR